MKNNMIVIKWLVLLDIWILLWDFVNFDEFKLKKKLFVIVGYVLKDFEFRFNLILVFFIVDGYYFFEF